MNGAGDTTQNAHEMDGAESPTSTPDPTHVAPLSEAAARSLAFPTETLEPPVDPWEEREKEWRAREQAQIAFLKSKEFERLDKWASILTIASAAVLGSGVCVALALGLLGVSWRIWVVCLVASLFLAAGLFGFPRRRLGIAVRRSRFTQADDALAGGDRSRRPRRGEDGAVPPTAKVPTKWLTDPDLQNLITFNSEQMNGYYQISTDQAKKAARNSQAAMAVGLLILVAGVIITLVTPDRTSKILVGGLASIGSVFSGYIGRTFLRAQDRARDQLDYYYRHPLVTSYLLSAERLTLKLSNRSRDRDRATADVVRRMLDAATTANDRSIVSDAKRPRRRARSRGRAAEESSTAEREQGEETVVPG